MPWIIDYQTVLDRLKGQGLRCQYFNGGVFGFAKESQTHIRGWIGPEDPTIKPAAQLLARTVPQPFEPNLANLAKRAWQELLPGNLWLMPASHWSYELNFGSRDWMPSLIESIDLDPGLLSSRTNAAAIEFSMEESDPFHRMIQRLLEMLQSSDVFITFPGRPATCTLHHHKQLWWTTTDLSLVENLDRLFDRDAEN